MSFRTNKANQLSLNDSFLNCSERTAKAIKSSWAGNFYEVIISNINEEKYSVLYSDHEASRPNTPINVIIGSLILKEMFHLSDDDVLLRLLTDICFQYALGTTSYTEQPMSDRTLGRFRSKLYHYELETGRDLLKETVEELADSFVKLAKMDVNMKRMDSLMISSNCKKMSRMEILYTGVANMIQRMDNDGFHIRKSMKHYLKSDDRNRVIYHEKGENIAGKLQSITKDALSLIKQMKHKDTSNSTEYKLLERIIDEQTNTNNGERVLKSKKEITPDSVQSTTDPEATYRNKAGKKNIGYVGNVVETIDEGKAVITSYDYQQNNYSDSQFCKDEINKMGNQEERTTLISDGAYGGADNNKIAETNNIALVTTALLGKNPDKIVADFEIDEKACEVKCPNGLVSTNVSINKEKYHAKFEKEKCEACPFKERCGVKFQKKSCVVDISNTMIDRASYLKKLETEEYKEYGKKRNGVEAVPSILRRKYRVDQIPVRGFVRSKLWYGLKIAALNAKRALKYDVEGREKELKTA